jgi:hypothetical protein
MAWPLWRLDHPEDLARYLAPVTVRSLVVRRADGTVGGLPGPLQGAPSARLAREIYDTLALVGLRYSDEQFGDGRVQRIAPPADVLRRPRRGNCLDVSLVFAAACLNAGLRPVLVHLASPGIGHALVLVDCEPDPEPAVAAVERPRGGEAWPSRFRHAIRSSPGDSSRYLPVDAAALAPADGEPVSFDEAVVRGHQRLSNPEWRWQASVALATAFVPDAAHLNSEAVELPLTAPYSGSGRSAGTDEGSALRLLDPRRGAVPFVTRPEYHQIIDHLRDDTVEPGVNLIVLYGDGGTGKTRLAAQIAHELDAEGWITGFLSLNCADEARDWLAHTAAPMLAVLDYPESLQDRDEPRPLLSVLAERPEGSRTFVLLTSRRSREAASARVWWEYLKDQLGDFPLPMEVRLPEVTMSPALLYRRALRGFAQALGRENALATAPTYDPSGKSALEIMLLAWLAQEPAAPGQQPSTNDLFEQVIGHEMRHWEKARRARWKNVGDVGADALRQAAACVSFLMPEAWRVADVLAAAPDIPAKARRQLVELFDTLGVYDDAGGTADGVAGPDGRDHRRANLRPDRVGEHVVATTCRAPGTTGFEGSPLLEELVGRATEQEFRNATTVMTRLAERDPETARQLAGAALRCQPEGGVGFSRAEVFFDQAMRSGGPCEWALTELAKENPQEVDDGLTLARRVPVGGVFLREFAAHLIGAGQPESYDPLELATQRIEESVRQSETGDHESRARAVRLAREAVQLCESIPEADVATADSRSVLAMSLNNLANRLSEIGEREEAVAAVEQVAQGARKLPDGAGAVLLNHCARIMRPLNEESARDLQQEAIERAEAEPDPTSAARARQAIRNSEILVGAAPRWAVGAINDAIVHRLETWASTPDWATRAQLVQSEADEVFGDSATLDTLRDLNPQLDWLQELIALRDPWRQGTLDQVLAELTKADETRRLIARWFATSTWRASIEFLDAHRETLLTDAVQQALRAAGDEPNTLRHLGIWHLADKGADTAELIEIVTNPLVARDEALNAVHDGRLERFSHIIAACPEAMQSLALATVALAQACTTTDEPEIRDAAWTALRQAALRLEHSDRELCATTLSGWRKADPTISDAIAPVLSVLDDCGLIAQWVQTPDWAASAQLLTDRHDDLFTDQVQQLLDIAAASSSSVMRQHAALWHLIHGGLEPSQAVAIAQDVDHAQETALDALRRGDLDMFQCIIWVCPEARQRPTMRAVWLATARAPDGNTDGESAAQRQAIEDALVDVVATLAPDGRTTVLDTLGAWRDVDQAAAPELGAIITLIENQPTSANIKP